MVEKQLKYQLVPAGVAAALRVAREEHAVQDPLFCREPLGHTLEEQRQHLLARPGQVSRDSHLLVVPLEGYARR
jgi:hypothetical protein